MAEVTSYATSVSASPVAIYGRALQLYVVGVMVMHAAIYGRAKSCSFSLALVLFGIGVIIDQYLPVTSQGLPEPKLQK